MKQCILIVDDEPRYIHLVNVNLLAEGYEVVTATDGEQAVEIVANSPPDLVIMDVVMPKLNGIIACERIRQFSDVPIIMLTARGEENDRIRGLNAGADDYVVKPFSAIELIARVKAVLRRSKLTEMGSSMRFFTHGSLKIDLARAEVWNKEKQIPLSATEYRLLIHFAHNLGHVLTAEELLSSIWGTQYTEDKEILWVSIARLRQKLEENPHTPRHIITRPGLGYVMPPIENETSERNLSHADNAI